MEVRARRQTGLPLAALYLFNFILPRSGPSPSRAHGRRASLQELHYAFDIDHYAQQEVLDFHPPAAPIPRPPATMLLHDLR